jgi:hypothetical protein
MYAILRAKKIKSKSKITNASRHNFRLRSQSNIDQSKTKHNKILFNHFGIDPKVGSAFQLKLTEFYSSLGIKEKKDNVLLYELVATASPEFFNDLPHSKILAWANTQVEIIKREFPQLKLAVLHLDEKTPHIHFFVSTEFKSVKKYKNRYGECEKETWSLSAKRYDPDFWKSLQTSFAEANSGFNLKRGERNSLKKNIPLKDFYRLVGKVISNDYEAVIGKIIDNIEIDHFERFSNKSIKKKIKDSLAPHLGQMMRRQSAISKLTKMNLYPIYRKAMDERHKAKEEQQELKKQKSDLDIETENLNKRVRQYSRERFLFLKQKKKFIQDSEMANQLLEELKKEARQKFGLGI